MSEIKARPWVIKQKKALASYQEEHREKIMPGLQEKKGAVNAYVHTVYFFVLENCKTYILKNTLLYDQFF